MQDYSFQVGLALQEVQNMAFAWTRPSIMMRPKLVVLPLAEKPWRASYGPVLGKGCSPQEAMDDFDRLWFEKEGK